MTVGIAEVRTVQGAGVTFYLLGNKIGVETRHQFLIFAPFNQYKTSKLKKAQQGISCGRIRTINELIESQNGIITISPGRKAWFTEQ